jgi:uncharacterized protein RhaS with RHS repeats
LILSSFAFQAQAFYHPDEGRWLSRDPIGERGGLNLHSFVENSPINSCDPLGQVAVIDDAAAVTAAYLALATAAAYLSSPQGQEQCRLVADGVVNGCACACDALRSVSNDAFQKAQKQLEVALTHFTYLAGSGHGKDPNDRWRNWNKWKSEIRTALENAKKKAKDCTTKAKDEVIRQVQRLEEQLKKIDDLPRGGD